MELLQLQYFVCVAKYENVSRASEELHVSQPALSSAIIRLEKELGAPLFDRTGRKLSLNVFGRYFLTNAYKILDLVSTSKYPISNSNSIREKISIAFQSYDAILWTLTCKFIGNHPDVCFDVYGNTMNASFADSNYDFIIGKISPSVSGMNCVFCIDSKYWAVVPRSHPLAARDSVRLTELKDDNFAFMHTAQGDLESAYKLCIDNGFVPKCTLTTNNPYYKFQFISTGMACALIPTGWKHIYESSPNVKVLAIENLNSNGEINFYWSDDAIHSSMIAREFLEFIKTNLTVHGNIQFPET